MFQKCYELVPGETFSSLELHFTVKLLHRKERCLYQRKSLTYKKINKSHYHVIISEHATRFCKFSFKLSPFLPSIILESLIHFKYIISFISFLLLLFLITLYPLYLLQSLHIISFSGKIKNIKVVFTSFINCKYDKATCKFKILLKSFFVMFSV